MAPLSLRGLRIVLSFVVAASIPSTSVADRRVVRLRSQPDSRGSRVEIRNGTSHSITFTLGFNDQLFENERALAASVIEDTDRACIGVEISEETKVACSAYQRVAASIIHSYEITDQFDANGWTRRPLLWFESPMLVINSFGFGTCGTYAEVLAKLWDSLGYDARRRNLDGHTVSEVRVDGRWLVFDADLRAMFVSDNQILGLDDLATNPTLAADPRVIAPLWPPRECDFPHAGPEYYTDILIRTGPNPEIAPIRSSSDDWRELVFTLPANATLRFPVASRSRCLFPELSDVSNTGKFGDVTSPPYQFAELDLPAGTRADVIENGLYPLFASGDYCLTAVYDGSTETTDDFDQLRRFRFSRRFAREFRDVEARSDTAIEYMINSKVDVKEANELRLEGEGVTALDVRLVKPPVEIAEPIPPCLAPGRPAAAVRRVTTSSNSLGNTKLAGNLADHQLMTAWQSDILPSAEPQQIVLELKHTTAIDGVRWAPDSAYAMCSPPDVVIETSTNGKNYREAATVSGYHPTTLDWFETNFEKRRARFVRLTLVPAPQFLVAGYFQVTLGEVEVLRPIYRK
jgi:F5/8 type C domain-containing protein